LAGEGDGAHEDPLTVANKANIKRLTMDVLLNLLLSHETSEGYKKLIEEELKRRERRGPEKRSCSIPPYMPLPERRPGTWNR
jgi:hypothetical protein